MVEKELAASCLSFFFAVFALLLIFRFVPIPFSAYMVQQKIANLYRAIFDIKSNITGSA